MKDRIKLFQILFRNRSNFMTVDDLHSIFVEVNKCEMSHRTIRLFINECRKNDLLDSGIVIVGKRRCPVKTFKLKTKITWDKIF